LFRGHKNRVPECGASAWLVMGRAARRIRTLPLRSMKPVLWAVVSFLRPGRSFPYITEVALCVPIALCSPSNACMRRSLLLGSYFKELGTRGQYTVNLKGGILRLLCVLTLVENEQRGVR